MSHYFYMILKTVEKSDFELGCGLCLERSQRNELPVCVYSTGTLIFGRGGK